MAKRQTQPASRVGETGHVLGCTYRCSYWREVYTVTALHDDGDVSVYWHGGNGMAARDGRHHTNVGKDKRIAVLCPQAE